MNINERLKKLQPYVIGLRFSETIPVIDCKFKDFWTISDSDMIAFAFNSETKSHICYSNDPNVTIDDLLDYIEQIINYNLDEENKVVLFKEKLNELKNIFESNSLAKLKTLEIVFNHSPSQPTKMDDVIKRVSNLHPQSQELIKKSETINDNNEIINEPQKRLDLDLSTKKDTSDSPKEIKPVCRCKPNESCSVCLGID